MARSIRIDVIDKLGNISVFESDHFEMGNQLVTVIIIISSNGTNKAVTNNETKSDACRRPVFMSWRTAARVADNEHEFGVTLLLMSSLHTV